MSRQHSSTSDEVNKMCKSTPYTIRLLDTHEAFQTLCHIQKHTPGKRLEYVNGKGWMKFHMKQQICPKASNRKCYQTKTVVLNL
jgi:hypothetical protein